jgi:hypothetical protein
MSRSKDLAWWYWLATVVLLIGWLGGCQYCIYLAIGLCLVQIVHFAWHGSSWIAFPVQVRAAYCVLLVAGLWEPLRPIHWIQLAGTSAVVVFGYCLLARVLSVLPWNRQEPISLPMLTSTFLSLPVRGNVMQGLSQISRSPEQLCSLRNPNPPRSDC